MTNSKVIDFKYNEKIMSHALITFPKDFDVEKESLPMIVFLHGAGERGNDINEVKRHGIPKLFDNDCEHRGHRVITLSPQCPFDDIWNHVVYYLKDFIDSVANEYNVNKNAITLTGISMGGFGTWEMAMTYPDYFAAIAPICGGGMAWRVGALVNLPIRVYHGDMDDAVPLEYSRLMVDKLKACGSKVEFTIFPGVNHNSWDPAYETTDLIDWLATAKK